LRDLQKHFGGAMIGGDFRDHLAVVAAMPNNRESKRNSRGSAGLSIVLTNPRALISGRLGMPT